MNGDGLQAEPASTDPIVWLNAFRHNRRGDRRHGVPLHQLDCSSEEYAQLRTLLYGRAPRKRADWMCFALFAVEWLRCNFDGGEWSYRGILAELGLPRDLQFDRDDLEEALEKGWGVEVLRTTAGRDFFGSLLLQALPVRTLASQRGVLGRYLPRLLRAAADGASLERLIALAAESRGALPVAWRGDTGLALLAGMARNLLHVDIEPLQNIDPVLRNVIDELAHRGRPTLRLQRTVVVTESSVEWRYQLSCPEVIDESDLQRIFGVHHLPEDVAKWEILVQTRDGARSRVGVATVVDGQSRRYHVVRDDVDDQLLARQSLEVVAHGGQNTLGPATVTSNEPLGALPWVFGPLPDDDTTWELLGQGSLHARSHTLLVALPADARFDVRTIPARVGTLGDRPLFQCSRPVVIHLGSSRCEIVPGADEDASTSHILEGDLLDDPVVGRPTYRGVPALVEISGNRRRRLPPSALQWRASTGGSWRTDVRAARGRVELRHAERDLLRWQAWVRIAPPHFQLTAVVVSDGECELSVAGLEPGMNARLETSHSTREIARNRWRITVAGEQRPSGTIVLRQADGDLLRLRCRLPVTTLGFELSNGILLQDGAEVGLDELHLVRVRASGPQHERARLTIHARVGKATSEFSVPLGPRGLLELLRVRDRVRTALAADLCIEAPVHLLIDDGLVRRTIVVRRWPRRIHCEGGRVTLSNRAGRIGPEHLADVEVEVRSFVDPTSRIRLHRVDGEFVLPGTPLPEPTMLLVARSHGRTWACPRACSRAKLSGGTLSFGLVAAPCSSELTRRISEVRSETADFESVTPTHVAPTESSELARALGIPGKSARCKAIDTVLAELSDDSQHPDWEILDCYVATLGDIHASTFDVFERILHRPSIAASILLRARVADFDRIWIGFEELPFSWDLVAIRDWLIAARLLANTWHDGGTTQLDYLAAHFDRMAALAARRSPAAPLVFQFIAAALFDRRECIQQLGLIATRLAPSLAAARDQAMQQLLRSAIATWPTAPGLSRLTEYLDDVQPALHDLVPRPPPGCGFRKPLLAAPAVAALLVVAPDVILPFIHEQRMDVVQLLTELRLLESGHPEWYRECFTLTLQLAAARHHHILLPRRDD